VPLYIRGALYVLDAPATGAARIEDYIEKKYVHGYMVQQASCDDRTLLYLRGMVEESVYNGQRFGRRHLAEQLQQALGIAVLESFQIDSDEKRLGEICRADADVCDRVLKLDPPNYGRGLCFQAGMTINRSPDDPDYASFLDACRKVDRRTLACVQYGLRGGAAMACERTIRSTFQR